MHYFAVSWLTLLSIHRIVLFYRDHYCVQIDLAGHVMIPEDYDSRRMTVQP